MLHFTDTRVVRTTMKTQYIACLSKIFTSLTKGVMEVTVCSAKSLPDMKGNTHPYCHLYCLPDMENKVAKKQIQNFKS